MRLKQPEADLERAYMGDYTYASQWAYSALGSQLHGSTTGGTVTDVNDDDEFDAGEAGPSPALVSPTVYYGTIEIGGLTYPVFQTTDVFAELLIISTTTDPLPTNISPGTINVGAPFPMCFAVGTQIATAAGQCAVEDLVIGDEVLSADGRLVPVKWIGRQTIFPTFNRKAGRGLVRVATGALGAGVPHADLTVTADHALLIDGVLCHAGALVNGSTITNVPSSELGQSYTVYHIETEDHEIILANGAMAETFIDNASRRAFDNFAEFDALYGDVPEMQELDYPRAMSTRQVPAHVRNRNGASKAA